METGLASVTKTAAAAETAVDVSALSAAAGVVWCEMRAMSAATEGVPSARIVIEQSAEAEFANPIPIAEFSFSGVVVPTAPVRMSQRLANLPVTQVGATSAKLRANLVQLLGGTPSCTYAAGLTT